MPRPPRSQKPNARPRSTTNEEPSSGRVEQASGQRPPRKIGRRLEFFDCLACDKCIPLCPNDANFTVRMPSTPELPLKVAKQLVHFADFCNDCGNCDIFCLEDGGPYLIEPRLFVDRERWLADAPRDAVLVEAGATSGRFGGEVVCVKVGQGPGEDPRARALAGLRSALLESAEVNHIGEYLRGRVSG